MTQSVALKGSRSGYMTTVSTSAFSVVIPGTTAAGDTVVIALTTNVNGRTMTAPAGWTIDYDTPVGTGQRVLLHRTLVAGDVWITATAGSASVACTWSTNGTYWAEACVVLDGTKYTGLGTIGAFTTRASSQTSTAAAAGSTAGPNLVIFHEKSTSQVSLTVNAPGVWLVEQLPTSGNAGTVGFATYDDSGSVQDITATTSAAANSNGGGVQYSVVLAVAHTAPTVSFTESATGTTVAFTDTTTLHDGAAVASQSWDPGDGSGLITTANPTYRYMRAGTYTVVHSVTDSQGATSSATQSVTVVGVSGDYWDGTAWHVLKATEWDGTTEKLLARMDVALNTGPTWSQMKANGQTLYGAHRGGSVDYVEMSAHAYWAAATLWPDHFLEISVQADADGVFWCQHDADFDRMVLGAAGTTLPVASSHAATISTYTQTPAYTSTPASPREPVARLTDVLATFGGKRVIFIERKGGSTPAALLNLMDQYGGPDWFVWKQDWNNGLQTSGDARVSTSAVSDIPGGKYDTWGYFFAGSSGSGTTGDMATFDQYQASATFVGLDYNLTDAALATAVATAGANRVIGHIIPDAANASRMLATGMRGLMVSGLREVNPRPF